MKSTKNTSSAQSLKKTDSEEYDLVILGGGTGSTIAAWTLAGQGKHVAVIELKYIGGSCPNIACLPSKNAIHSAKVASYLRRTTSSASPKETSSLIYARCSRTQTQDGIELESRVPRKLQEERRGIHPRLWTLHWH